MRIRNLIWILCLLTVGCGGDVESPEQQIQSMLTAAEQAVKSRSVAEVTPFIAKTYRDEVGRDRHQLAKLLNLYFLRYRNIQLLMQIESIELTGESRARVVLYVTMIGQRNSRQLIDFGAGAHYFQLELEKQQDAWLVSSGKWWRASKNNF